MIARVRNVAERPVPEEAPALARVRRGAGDGSRGRRSRPTAAG